MNQVLYEGGFAMRRGELDSQAGFVQVRGEPAGVSLQQTIRGLDYALVTAYQRLTPDEAIELAGALETAAKAVWAHHNERNLEDGNGRT